MSKFFDELMESAQQMNDVLRGQHQPSQESRVDALTVVPTTSEGMSQGTLRIPALDSAAKGPELHSRAARGNDQCRDE